MPLARKLHVYGLGLIGQEQGGEYLTYHFYFRGSAVALTDENAQVTERFQYSPYGVLVSGEVSATPFLFNGMYGVMSDDNGLYYMRALDSNPEIRRFVNQDVLLGGAVEGQGLNRYAFVTGQPVSFVDPFGLAKYCGDCVGNEYDCLLRGGNLCSEQPDDDEIPRPYTGGASNISIQFLAAGFSYDHLVSQWEILKATYLDLSSGVAGDLGFVQSLGFDASCGIDENGITSLGSSKSSAKAGFGGGFWLGITLCFSAIVECKEQ